MQVRLTPVDEGAFDVHVESLGEFDADRIELARRGEYDEAWESRFGLPLDAVPSKAWWEPTGDPDPRNDAYAFEFDGDPGSDGPLAWAVNRVAHDPDRSDEWARTALDDFDSAVADDVPEYTPYGWRTPSYLYGSCPLLDDFDYLRDEFDDRVADDMYRLYGAGREESMAYAETMHDRLAERRDELRMALVATLSDDPVNWGGVDKVRPLALWAAERPDREIGDEARAWLERHRGE